MATLSIIAIFSNPSSFRSLIWPLATKAEKESEGLRERSLQLIAETLRRGSLRLVLEHCVATVPGLFFPSRAQVSPALRAFVGVRARGVRGGVRRAGKLNAMPRT